MVVIHIGKRAETSPNLDIHSKHNVIGRSFNPNIISEDTSQTDGKELTIGDGDLTHEGDIKFVHPCMKSACGCIFKIVHEY